MSQPTRRGDNASHSHRCSFNKPSLTIKDHPNCVEGQKKKEGKGKKERQSSFLQEDHGLAGKTHYIDDVF